VISQTGIATFLLDRRSCRAGDCHDHFVVVMKRLFLRASSHLADRGVVEARKEENAKRERRKKK
jgi:hypothetical protein